MQNNILDAKKVVADLNEVWKQQVEVLALVDTNLEKLNAEYKKLPSEYIKQQKDLLIIKNRQASLDSKLLGIESKKIAEADRLIQRQKRNAKEKQALDDRALRDSKRIQAEKDKAIAKAKKEEQALAKNNREWVELTTSLREAEDEYKDIAVATGQFSKATLTAQKRVQDLRAKVDGINAPIKRFGDNVGNYPTKMQAGLGMVKNLIGAFGIIEGLRFGFNFSKEAVLMANSAKGIDRAFDKIANSADILERARKQTRGLSTDLEIKAAANEFKNFGLNVENIPTLLEFVSLTNKQTGKSFENLQQSIVEGISKKSKLRIDNLGIGVADLNAELLVTNDNFEQAVTNIAIRRGGNIFCICLFWKPFLFGNTNVYLTAFSFTITKIKRIGSYPSK